MAAEHGYEIKGVKTFQGREGGGYNANLYLRGKKIAEVIDDAGGGPLQIHWLDHATRSPVEVTEHGKARTVMMTSQEKALHDHILTLPPIPADVKTGCPEMSMNDEIFIDDLVNDVHQANRLKTLMRNKTVFITGGAAYTNKSPHSPAVAQLLRDKYPDCIVLNALSFDEALSHFKAHA